LPGHKGCSVKFWGTRPNEFNKDTPSKGLLSLHQGNTLCLLKPSG